LKKGGREFAYYIPKGSVTVRARHQDETELMSLAATVPFDDRLNQRAVVEDLSRELMLDFLQEVGSDLFSQVPKVPLIELGRQMHVIGGPDEAPFPLNVGLLFSTRNRTVFSLSPRSTWCGSRMMREETNLPKRHFTARSLE